MGAPVIVINSREAAKDLLEGRSLIYADRFGFAIPMFSPVLLTRCCRPNFPMLNDLMGFGWETAFAHYGEVWKAHRKIFYQEFGGSNAATYNHQQVDSARFLLRRLLDDPDVFMDSIRLMAGRMILGLTYGINVKAADDYYLQIAEASLKAMAVAANAGSFLVDIFPLLRFTPDWFPGAGFKRKAKEWRKPIVAMPAVTMDFVEQSIVGRVFLSASEIVDPKQKNGSAEPSIAYKYLSQMDADEARTKEAEEILSGTMASFYAGGADTTVSTLCSFVLAMVLYPEVQKKGQAAVDEATGSGRLPEFNDCKSMPYLQAIVNEVLRWAPVVPLAISHRCSEDNKYRGYDIPAGATVVGNVWALLNDESAYGPDTHKFSPDRFMKDGNLNPAVPFPSEAFGFGRRICPGQNLAVDSVRITIASLLAVFEFGKAVNGDGKTIEPSGEYTSGMLSYPMPFKCSIRPRSDAAVSMINLED
ncbi:cytochrome P450 [Armillaria borealis]|uniref:Cytochrome P450 n=1 Tax=Armillaria borealis TaxID=47425 RepID=A0AA39J7E3_9AGAR|nr:cytochrome P450 [Armillaria borealis]